MKPSLLLLIVVTLASACGGGGTGSTASPSSTSSATSSPSGEPSASGSPAPSPLPPEASYGVLITPASSTEYVIDIVDSSGRRIAEAQAANPTRATCGDGSAAVLPPPVSISNTRAYFMDAQGVVHFLDLSGATGRATTVPMGTSRRSTFSVSPDNRRIAVVVSDFTSSGAATSLYVEDLSNGANHKVIFTENGSSGLWPVGWHAGGLVVAKVPVCTQGGTGFCCGPQELHLVDATTAARRATLGDATCILAGPASPAGAVCETDAQANVLDWTGTTTRSFSVQGPTPAYLSPNGNQAALDKANPSNFLDTVVEGSNTTFTDFEACGWVDSSRVLGINRQGQPVVGDFVTGTTKAVGPVPTFGPSQCAGRLPGAF